MSTTFSDVLNVTSSMTSSNESSDQEEADDRFLVFGAVIKVSRVKAKELCSYDVYSLKVETCGSDFANEDWV